LPQVGTFLKSSSPIPRTTWSFSRVRNCTRSLSACSGKWRVEVADAQRGGIAQEPDLSIAEINASAWSLKGKFPVGQDPDALMVGKDITERGKDF